MAAQFLRKDVWKLQQWDPILLWYAKAVGELSTRPPSDVTSWRFQGAIHDYDPGLDPFQGSGTIDTANGPNAQFLLQCQHSSWFFLPWHRMYLGFFEEIVRAAVVKLGGPADWALPYWNYSDASNAQARQLPLAFRQPTLPDGSPNSLFVIQGIQIGRAPGVDQGNNITNARGVDIKKCLGETQFEADNPKGGDPGFGGPDSGFNHKGGPVGSLENIPHGTVHDGIGGNSGWMSFLETAALDPIFWLHHANIDRLWTVWKLIDPVNNVDPPGADWQTAQSFSFNDATGGVATMTPSQVLVSATSRFSYDYEDTSNPLAAAPVSFGVTAGIVGAGKTMKPRAIPEMVGATSEPTVLTGDQHSATFAVSEPAGPAISFGMGPGEPPRQTFLNIEDVTGQRAVGGYEVYVNLPDGADPAASDDYFAGIISMFGISEASEPSARNSGSGLHYSLNITDLVDRLKARQAWNPSQLHVTFVPRSSTGHPPVRVGRVSLYHA
jgi:tyrosinase